MTRRIILILLGALVVLALMFALWFWLFGKQAEVGENLGGFGSADDRGVGAGGGDSTGNTQTTIGGTSQTNGTGNVQTPLYVSPTYQGSSGGSFNPGDFDYDIDINVDWLDGSNGSGGSGVAFNPTPINQLNNASIEGTPYFNSATGGGGGGGNNGLGIGGVFGACLAQFLAAKAAASISTVATRGVNALLRFFSFGAVGAQEVYDPTSDANQQADNMIECVVRALAKVAIQQITAQTVSWINSGFNGEPAFVQDFGKFFNDVSDRAAGDVIQGSDLSFLCSPFQLQVRIAVAQSYARQSGGAAAQSCTLTDVIGNVESFMNGNFSEGGWPGLISFTTVPTNNPFGAYVGAQVLLNSRIQGEKVLAERKISTGGFLAQEQCTGPVDPATGKKGPPCKIITHGATIEAALDSVIDADLRGLEIASSIDQILSALLNSLTTNLIKKGLANITSNDVGGDPLTQDTQALTEAQALLQKLQAAVQRAQQYGSIQQGSIADIQNTQVGLTNLQNCWVNKNSSNAATAEAQVETLEGRIASYNTSITRANTAIARIQQIQSQALLATNVAGVRAAETLLTQAETSGTLITTADVTLAQQNRTTLQAEMAATNQQTSLQLNQCYAS